MSKKTIIALLAATALAGFAAIAVLLLGDQPTPSLPPEPAAGTMHNFIVSNPPKPVPAVTFERPGGAPAGLDAYRGKVLLVNLWASWCVPCRVEMPALDKLAADLDGPNFQVIALAEHDSLDKAQAFLDKVGAHHVALAFDQTMKSAYALGTEGLPATLLIDREGREVGRVIGPAEWSSPEVRALVRNAIDGKVG